MTRTPIKALVAAGVFVAAAVAIVAWTRYGVFPPLSPLGSVTLWILALIVISLTVMVRSAMNTDRGVGLDRSQLNPMTIARCMALAKAAAWTGALLGGVYLGIATFVVPNASWLAAAAEELLTVVTAAAGGIVLSVAGVVLERHCESPPPPDGAQGSLK